MLLAHDIRLIFIQIAVEEAIRLKEAKKASEIVAVTIGPKGSSETLRSALAMGCDRGIHVQTDLRTDYFDLQPFAISQILQQIYQLEKADLVLLGKQGIDSDCGQTGPLLAGLLGIPQITFAAKLQVNDGKITVERETDTGTETIESKLPAVVTCDLRLNTPRYTTLPNIMKAKKKPVQTIDLQTLAADGGMDISLLEPRNKVLEVMEPPPRKAGVMVQSVDELIDKLRNEAKVLK